LDGGEGSNTLTGGRGDDIFRLTTNASSDDRITDFAIGHDQIDLGAVPNFNFIGTSNFTNVAGQVRYSFITDRPESISTAMATAFRNTK
jgi:Ca2+-binding RTX toxin-like protein